MVVMLKQSDQKIKVFSLDELIVIVSFDEFLNILSEFRFTGKVLSRYFVLVL